MRIGTDAKYLEFNSVNKVEIEESVKTLGNKATLTLPRNYSKFRDKSILDLLKSGDQVSIWLGYDGDPQQEFKGYLQEIESGAPLVLHVDDEFYPFKRNTFKKAWKTITLKELLQFVAPGLKIVCPEVNLGQFEIENASTFRVLISLQEQYGFYTSLTDGTLTCLWPFKVGMSEKTHTYTFYTPTVKNNSLKYHRADDVKVHVRATSNLRNGKKPIMYETGSKEHDSSLFEIKIPGATLDELKKFADAKLQQLCFDGYSGTISGFGTPRTHAGDTIQIVDTEEPDRQGNYLVDSVKITYDLTQGFERENTLSYKV
ncbi:hypothetical protein [Williamwhitmania taraxaci]|uniref:hypothetical protein n=1 Tax=Williamwhitmania taraxaci TaxID=1640674 RepID=UPI000F780048|nr:hypothetical protein [Williamwhitmania taraxaci]